MHHVCIILFGGKKKKKKERSVGPPSRSDDLLTDFASDFLSQFFEMLARVTWIECSRDVGPGHVESPQGPKPGHVFEMLARVAWISSQRFSC